MNVYLISNIELNLFSIKIVKTKEISVKIKNRLLHLKNKVVKRWHHTNSIAIMSYISNTLSNPRLASTLIHYLLSFS